MKERTVMERGFHFDYSLDVIRGKWKALIIWNLRNELKRFSELEKLLPGIKRKVLIMQLNELKADGIILRTVYPEVPPRVEYTLTDAGRHLLPIFQIMNEWAEDYIIKDHEDADTTTQKVVLTYK